MTLSKLSPSSVAVNPLRDRDAVEVDALAETFNALLVQRGDERQLIELANLPEEVVRRQRDHARRSLAERDPIKVGIAHYRGVRALYAAIEDLFLGGVRQLTSAQRAAYRIAFYRALTAYQASLEGHLGEPNREELAAAIARKEPSAS